MEEELGFISEYSNFILEHVPTTLKWAEANALCLLSIASGPEKYVRMKPGPLRLNVWNLMIGPSGLGHKSLPINSFAIPVLGKLKDLINVDIIVPVRYSVEGMIEWLSKHSSHGGIVRDEFTTLFKELTKSYLGDNLEFLSELYDGRMQKRFTRGYKLEQVQSVYISFLSATTPHIYRVMDPEFFIQGTGNRIRIIMFDGKIQKMDSPEDWEYTGPHYAQTEREIEKFVEILSDVYTSEVNVFALQDEALKKWVEYRSKVFEDAEKRLQQNQMDLVYTYMVRLPEISLKLAALCRLSNRAKVLKETTFHELVLKESDVEYGIKKEEEALRDFKTMLDNWRHFRPMPEPITTARDKIWKVCSFLLYAPNRMLNTEQWRDNQDVVSDSTFYSFRNKALEIKWIRLVDRSEIQNEIEKTRLGVSNPATKVWTITKEYLKV